MGKYRFAAASIALLQLLLILLAVFHLSLPTASAAQSKAVAAQAQPGLFSHKAFESIWQRLDQPIATKQSDRSWYWGPAPLATGLYETYLESPYGQRLVQYFDKARMEINNPATGGVTNGLLVVELMTGRVQQGDNTFDDSAFGGASVAVVGDNSNTYPTYRQLASVFNKPDPAFVTGLTGQPVVRQWYREGRASADLELYKADQNTQVARIENGLGIPQAFWNFINQQGTIYSNGRFDEQTLADWRFAVGLPLTEAYWARVKVAGVDKDVLFQPFERRVLTYTPANPAPYQVEMGNIGQHYVEWRYQGQLPKGPGLLMNLFTNPTQPQWYETTEVLNIRTAPTASANLPSYSLNRPFVTQLQPGDRLKVLRAVQGEEVEPGNKLWYQIYEKPDLFIYSKYTQRLTVPAFPSPPRTNKGMWVAVSIDKQMMAVYNNQELIFSTLVATGRKGYETVRGNFSAIGGWRPLTQTMQGGNRAAGDGYKIEEVRYVTYFFRDYAIHGSYWHAKYGLTTQSHGCVNATVYDASLIHQLPVGTPVEVF